MHKNTLVLTIILAIIAAIVAGVNIANNSKPSQQAPTPAPFVTPTPAYQTYSDPQCGIAFQFANTYESMDSQNGGTLLTDKTNPKKAIAVTCDKTIDRPKMAKDQIETTTIGTVSATIFKDREPQSDTAVLKLFVRHPSKKLDIFIAGSDGALEEIQQSIRFID